MSRVYWVCTAVGVVNGIGIDDKEERLCRLGTACAAELNIGAGNRWRERLALQPEWTGCRTGKTGRVYRWVRPTEECLVAIAVATGHNPRLQPLILPPNSPYPIRIKWAIEMRKRKLLKELRKTIPYSVPSNTPKPNIVNDVKLKENFIKNVTLLRPA